MKYLVLIVFGFYASLSYAAKPKPQYVKIVTSKGECVLRLYDETPLHRDNFIKLAKSGAYNNTIFHRVIQAFMVQGGDTSTRHAVKPPRSEGQEKVTIPAEFNDMLFHKKGALAAAREGDNVNPLKASSNCQFYIVQGKVWTDSLLNVTEEKHMKHKIPEEQREVYKTLGGSPHLDRNYTVFGEVVKGLEMVDSIAEVQKGPGNRSLEDIRMTVSILKKKEIRRLNKELTKQKGV